MPKGVYDHIKQRGMVHSKEWNDKISNANLGKTFSDERRKNMSEILKGRKLSEDHKQKIRAYRHTDEAKEKIRKAMTGRKFPDRKPMTKETKLKIGAKAKGRKHTEEAKEKVRNFLIGRKRPELTGENNPMHTHPNAYKSKFGKTGYRKDLNTFVKSRWEANMMRIFKYLGFNVQYEPQSFRLSNGKTYRPDFLLHETGELVEVKGRWLKDAKERFMLFKKEYPGLPIDLIEKKEYNQYINEFKNVLQLE